MIDDPITAAQKAMITLAQVLEVSECNYATRNGRWTKAAVALSQSLGYHDAMTTPKSFKSDVERDAFNAARQIFLHAYTGNKTPVQAAAEEPPRDLITVAELLAHWEGLRALPGNTPVCFGGEHGISIRYGTYGVAIEEHGYAEET